MGKRRQLKIKGERQKKIMEVGDAAFENCTEREDTNSISANMVSDLRGLIDESACGDGVPLDMSMDPFL